MSEPAIPPSPSPSGHSWLKWIGGAVLALAVGGVLNIFSGLIGASTNMKVTAFPIGAVPGVLFILLALALRKNSPAFAGGLLVGGCVIALVGGACSASFVGATFH